MTPEELNIELLERVRERYPKRKTPFGYGIVPASVYVESVLQCVQTPELDAAKAIKEAQNLATYANDEMTHQGYMSGGTAISEYCKSLGIEKPPHTLMAFENFVTTTRQDRDGDVLDTKGAVIDKSMPVLWHHMLPMPAGRMLKVISHTDTRLKVASAIVDSKLGQDCAQLIEFGALRISHGFRPLKAQQMSKSLDPDSPFPGMLISKFEVIEESLVTVPSNTDAIITAHSRGKLCDPVVKSWAKHQYENRTKVFGSASVEGFTDVEIKSDGTQVPPEHPPIEDEENKGKKKDEKKDEEKSAEVATKEKCPECGLTCPPTADEGGMCSECGSVCCGTCGRCAQCAGKKDHKPEGEKGCASGKKPPEMEDEEEDEAKDDTAEVTGAAAGETPEEVPEETPEEQPKEADEEDEEEDKKKKKTPGKTSTKYGRVISNANEAALRAARDMADQCSRTVQAVLDQVQVEAEGAKPGVTGESDIMVASASPVQKMLEQTILLTSGDIGKVKSLVRVLTKWIESTEKEHQNATLREFLSTRCASKASDASC